MTAQINVNLTPCDCWKHREPGTHQPKCVGRPVPISCPLPPTWTLKVSLWKCGKYPACTGLNHAIACPVRTVPVTCSIAGETWEGSNVIDVFGPNGECLIGEGQIPETVTLRWAVVKALVLGEHERSSAALDPASSSVHWAVLGGLIAERDERFAAFAKMARLEEAHEAVRLTLPASCRPIPPTGGSTPRPSAQALQLFVAYVMGAVGALP